jgi:hypothetical protein
MELKMKKRPSDFKKIPPRKVAILVSNSPKNTGNLAVVPKSLATNATGISRFFSLPKNVIQSRTKPN